MISDLAFLIRQLDTQGYGLVSLADLRFVMGGSRQQQDERIMAARRARSIQLVAHEGYRPLSAAERAAAIDEDVDCLAWCKVV